MISYVIFLMNMFELFMSYNDMNWSCSFMDKNLIKDILDFMMMVKYTIYSSFKYLCMQMHYYYLMIYTIFVLPHLPFLSFTLKSFYMMKKTLTWYVRYFKYWSKKRKWWKTYYSFHSIYHFKFLFFALFIMLFILMWNRSQTYLKLGFFLSLFFFYMLSLYLSDMLVVLFDYSVVGHMMALLMSWFMVFMTLN